MNDRSERAKRAVMAIGSAIAYGIVFGVVLWFDRRHLPELDAGQVQFVMHAHVFLALAMAVWVLGFERFNPLVAAALLVDLAILHRDRITAAAMIVIVIALISCVYATVRNVSVERQRNEETRHV